MTNLTTKQANKSSTTEYHITTTRRILPPTSDFVFKQLFGNIHDTEILSAFLKAILDLPDDEIDSITITDPHLQRERENDKLGIVDVRVRTKSKRELDIEVQVQETDFMKNRIEFYNAKMLTCTITALFVMT